MTCSAKSDSGSSSKASASRPRSSGSAARMSMGSDSTLVILAHQRASVDITAEVVAEVSASEVQPERRRRLKPVRFVRCQGVFVSESWDDTTPRRHVGIISKRPWTWAFRALRGLRNGLDQGGVGLLFLAVHGGDGCGGPHSLKKFSASEVAISTAEHAYRISRGERKVFVVAHEVIMLNDGRSATCRSQASRQLEKACKSW